MLLTSARPGSTHVAAPAPPRPRADLRASRRVLEACSFACLLAVNWMGAALTPSWAFSFTSAVLFAWMAVFFVRVQPRAAALALPLLITRGATVVSLIFIEAGSAMPEIGRSGAPGDACASFVAFSSLLFLGFGAVFALGERWAVAGARSPLLDRLVVLARWPTIALCALLGLAALAAGARTGFPLFEHVDRFYYRRVYGGSVVLPILDNKFILGAVLGSIAFGRNAPRVVRWAAAATMGALMLVFGLFGDKFFTLLTTAAYFATPYLLQREQALLRTLTRAWLPALVLLAGVFGATLYIYSDYGTAPVERGVTRLGDRIAGQGELWWVATQDNRHLYAFDRRIAEEYAQSLEAPEPTVYDFAHGLETYGFIYRYTPQPLRRSFIHNQGWVQLTMGYEASALVSFGYAGVVVLSLAGGGLAALAALYLRRAFASEFPVSIALAVWTTLQAYIFLQQAEAWALFARGQVRRFFLFLIFEVVLFGLNHGQGAPGREGAAAGGGVPAAGGRLGPEAR